MGVLYWNIIPKGKFKSDFALQCIIWMHAMCVAEAGDFKTLHLHTFQGNTIHDFFQINSHFDIKQIDSSPGVNPKDIVSISTKKDIIRYKAELIKGRLFDQIIYKLVNMRLVDNIHNIIESFGNKSISVIDTRGLHSHSLRINERCDPELHRHEVMFRIPPGNEILIFRDVDQPKLQSFEDIYTIRNLNIDNDINKQCIELYLLLRQRVNFYYCRCVEYSTKCLFLFNSCFI
tara:strand:- start:378 stop:1073 length:696 start_codon:yes stop_codon:yes gene_type:complete